MSVHLWPALIKIPNSEIPQPSNETITPNHYVVDPINQLQLDATSYYQPSPIGPIIYGEFDRGMSSITNYNGSANSVNQPSLSMSHRPTNSRPRPRLPALPANRISDPRPDHLFRSLDGYHGKKNSADLLDCFKDCIKRHLGTQGFTRRGNLLAHLRRYHGQDIPKGG